jgi:hypothetical protein
MKSEKPQIPFRFICEIIPELDTNGFPKEYLPQIAYRNAAKIPLNKYGRGPFCRFRIRNRYGKTGVYAISVNNVMEYIGECQDLAKRWNNGYGNISPRNCFTGGRPTNCRINNLIYQTVKECGRITLLFFETDNRFEIEHNLINELRPEWNRTTGKIPIASRNLTRSENTKLKTKASLNKTKYNELKKYLEDNKKNTVVLSYEDIERIIGTKLPKSAYRHRAWWSNSGHPHARTWSDSGWKVISVELGQSVTFTNTRRI